MGVLMSRWVVFLFLICFSTLAKAEEEEVYQTGTEVLLSHVAQQINEAKIKK